MASGAVALIVAATVAVYAVTDNEVLANVCYLGVLVGASLGAWIGAERAPRGRRLVPRLIAAGISLTALGDVLWTLLDLMGVEHRRVDRGPAVVRQPTSFSAPRCGSCSGGADEERSRVDVDFVIDAVTIVVVSVLIFWSISVDTIVADHSVTPFVRTVWAAYPIVDAVLLALVVRVLLSRSARAAIDASFAVGVCLWLAADIAYLQAPEGETALVMMDIAWMVAPVLMARAAWRVCDTSAADASAPRPSAAGWRSSWSRSVPSSCRPRSSSSPTCAASPTSRSSCSSAPRR